MSWMGFAGWTRRAESSLAVGWGTQRGPSPGGLGSRGVNQWGRPVLAKRCAETLNSPVIKKQGVGGQTIEKKKKAEVCLCDAAWKC